VGTGQKDDEVKAGQPAGNGVGGGPRKRRPLAVLIVSSPFLRRRGPRRDAPGKQRPVARQRFFEGWRVFDEDRGTKSRRNVVATTNAGEARVLERSSVAAF